MLDGKNILIGVSGSIAAYKIASLVSMLKKQHANVIVIMTENATRFITPVTFETLTGRKCLVDTFDRNFEFSVEHVSVAKSADIAMVAPASANVIGKMACGIADDMLTTTLLACRCPVLVSPAMNTAMYENAAVVANLSTLRSRGIQIIEPASGYLACGDVGAGKMPEPEELYSYIVDQLAGSGREQLTSDSGASAFADESVTSEGSNNAPGDDGVALERHENAPGDGSKASEGYKAVHGYGLTSEARESTPDYMPLMGKRVLITAGPTREAIDPVRFITNHSTGKMGYALAQQAVLLGARVVLVSGPVNLDTPQSVERIDVVSAAQMSEAVKSRANDSDIIICCAAVADMRPASAAPEKLKKADMSGSLELEPTEDILAYLGAHRRSDQVLVGFSMETENMLENSRAKLIRKGADMIVANNVKVEGAGFGTDTNIITIITETSAEELPLMSKTDAARKILERVADALNPSAVNALRIVDEKNL